MEPKEAAALSAARTVKDGQVVGLGTGSTVYYAIKELGRRAREEDLDILGIPTSLGTELLAVEEGIKLTTLAEHPELDLAIDGADEVDRLLNLIKGGGGAHTREKAVATAAARFLVAVDGAKLKERLSMPVPVEVLPFSRRLAEEALKSLGGRPAIRMGVRKAGPVITDNGNILLDVSFGIIRNPGRLEEEIKGVIGVVESGIFAGYDPEVHVGPKDGGVVRILRPP